MDESHQGDPPKPKKLKEEDDEPTSCTSQDVKTRASQHPNTAKRRHGNEGQEKKDREVGNGSSKSMKAKRNETKEVHEKKENLELEKIEDNGAACRNVESSHESLAMTDRNSGSAREKDDMMGAVSEQGNRSKLYSDAIGNSSRETPTAHSTKVTEKLITACGLYVCIIYNL
jgi:nitric oxide reductase activation protein